MIIELIISLQYWNIVDKYHTDENDKIYPYLELDGGWNEYTETR